MKSNVVLQSSDRELFGITIRQNTKGHFLSVTDLQKAYEKARWQFGWSDKKINDMLSWTDTKLRVYYLLKEADFIKTSKDEFMEMVEKETLLRVLKGLDLWKTTGRGENKTVMTSPYIWFLLAMELNPMLYAKVIIWLTDSLIFDRIDAGSEYLPMNSAIKSVLGTPDYPKFATSINTKVFGFHQTGMRNIASSKELRKIADIEKFIINAIANGWLKSEEDIINAIKSYK